MKIKELYVIKEKGKQGSPEKSITLFDKGIQGDKFARGGEKQISIADSSLIERMRRYPDRFGSCAGKFKANIITEACRVAGIRKGDILQIAGAEIEITEDTRECNTDNCPIAKEGKSCDLKYASLFGKVKKPGEIKTGDTIKVKMNLK